jgi:hypothetical protein
MYSINKLKGIPKNIDHAGKIGIIDSKKLISPYFVNNNLFSSINVL